jgi:hypothetical protein
MHNYTLLLLLLLLNRLPPDITSGQGLNYTHKSIPCIAIAITGKKLLCLMSYVLKEFFGQKHQNLVRNGVTTRRKC